MTWLLSPTAPNYEVSDSGEVRRASAARGTSVGRLRRQTEANNGYKMVTLPVRAKVCTFLVPRLVAEAFIGPPGDREVNHKNLNKHDNRLENLEYMSRSENLLHRAAHGIGRGEDNASARLTAAQVCEIRARHPAEGYKRLAQAFGVRPETVRDIIKRRIWRHL